MVVLLHLNSHNSSSTLLLSRSTNSYTNLPSFNPRPNHLNFSKIKKLRAVETASNADQSDPTTPPPPEDGPPSVKFAFVSSVLLPDGTPDVHYRSACGGQKLREVMLDNNIELYGPYARPLLNCAGGGTCGTCMVEVIEGRELMNLRTEKEKELLKKKPKNWRLACQAIVGEPDSRGMVVIQQLPEWKAHQWNYAKELPEDVSYI